MVSYEQAYEIAKKLKPNIDACDEYSDAFLFKTKADEWTIGGESPCVVLKENGNAITQLEYFDKYEARHIRGFDIN